MNDLLGPQIGLPEHNNLAKNIIAESGINMTIDPNIALGIGSTILNNA